MQNRRLGPAERPNFGEPTTPRPSASVVLVRGEAGAGLEVLLVRRAESVAFMPDTWVFPGGAVDADDEIRGETFRNCATRELAEEAGVTLPAGHELVLFSRWITPAIVSRRFDARFFLALAPPDVAPRPDGAETTAVRWLDPTGALAEAERGELAIALPTLNQLRSLRRFASAEEALAAYRGREIDPVLPVFVPEGDGRIVLPGEPGYPA